ncbi:Zinc finger, PHD-type [Corchorus olitorius]|uniref:Zinc finger, PHD-type n=1 Tax=Corchorus olitorius TaxID=93759 RepID=A0A1R3HFB3_9ROSI|nr:Zinc finger, PHD-type [Corchorus olitorius]
MSATKESVNLTSMQHSSHDHPLEFIEEQNNGSEEVDCSGCGDPIEGSCYCCTDCKFYLHKSCTDLPLNIDHSLHEEHTLNLQVKSPYSSSHPTYCDFCYNKTGFFYHCSSCQFDLDVKCAISPNLSAGDFFELEHSSHRHPLILVDQRKSNQVKRVPCAACEEPTSGPIYRCIECIFYLHKKCLELPSEITHPSHNKHPLTLLTNPPLHREGCSCYLCKNPCKGFIYHCSICEFGIKVKHILSSQSEKGTHQHPFILLSKPISFFCDACGTDGDCIPYICTTCNLAVHKECISLPHMIKIPRHVHPISHVYCLPDKENKLWECRICYNEVKTEFGSYYCSESDCNYIVHVNCVREKDWLRMEVKDVLSKETMGLVPDDKSGCSAEDVTDTEIKHFDHEHNLMLSEEKIEDTYCDGCMQTISGSFYFCKQCNFFLHNSCAKLPMKTKFWFSWSQYLLQKHSIFNCDLCDFWISGFSYISERGTTTCCLGCCARPDILTHEGHSQHPIFFDNKCEEKCTACGVQMSTKYRCKNNDFAIDHHCLSMPLTLKHKSDKHPLKLTYHDSDDPSQHYCDICEEKRDSAYWFYSCADCNFAAHSYCTLGEYHFINQGVPQQTISDRHPHRLFTVKKVYYYPPCKVCDEPCLDLALECREPDCDYIIHWDCRWYLDV